MGLSRRRVLVVLAALVAAPVVAAVRRGLLIIDVEGVSMSPSILPGTRLLVRRCGLRRLRRGCVVVASPPSTADPRLVHGPGARRLVKRVVALPGDDFRQDLYPALAASDDTLSPSPGMARVPPGHFVVLGDNLARSLDSRALGLFRADGIIGVPLRTLHRPDA